MAELKTPQGLIVGLIPNEMLEKMEPVAVEQPQPEKAVEKPTRGRKPKE